SPSTLSQLHKVLFVIFQTCRLLLPSRSLPKRPKVQKHLLPNRNLRTNRKNPRSRRKKTSAAPSVPPSLLPVPTRSRPSSLPHTTSNALLLFPKRNGRKLSTS